MVVAYVELDSLNNNVFYQERKKELEAEQKTIATEYENSYRELTAERDNFLKKGKCDHPAGSGRFQEKLGQNNRKLKQTKQAKSQKLAEKGARIMEDMQRKA